MKELIRLMDERDLWQWRLDCFGICAGTAGRFSFFVQNAHCHTHTYMKNIQVTNEKTHATHEQETHESRTKRHIHERHTSHEREDTSDTRTRDTWVTNQNTHQWETYESRTRRHIQHMNKRHMSHEPKDTYMRDIWVTNEKTRERRVTMLMGLFIRDSCVSHLWVFWFVTHMRETYDNNDSTVPVIHTESTHCHTHTLNWETYESWTRRHINKKHMSHELCLLNGIRAKKCTLPNTHVHTHAHTHTRTHTDRQTDRHTHTHTQSTDTATHTQKYADTDTYTQTQNTQTRRHSDTQTHRRRHSQKSGCIVCCSVLQCYAVCCSALQCVAVCRSVLQCVAVCRSVLQCVAMCCSVVQCVAALLKSQHVSSFYMPTPFYRLWDIRICAKNALCQKKKCTIKSMVDQSVLRRNHTTWINSKEQTFYA